MRPPPFKLERYFARYEFDGLHLLGSSDCEAMTLKELLSHEPSAKEELERLWLGYTESQGNPRLRQSIARIYDDIDSGQVLVHSGAEEVIFNFMNVAPERGDHIVVHRPGYPSTHTVAASNGVDVTFWEAREQDGWSLDPDDLRDAITPRTIAIVLNCPNNPTGYLMDPERFDATVEIARESGLYLFSDEVYRELEHDPADRLLSACDAYEKGVSVGVLSKTYGLPGLRIGWVATRDGELLARMAAFKDYLTICNSAPSELLARVALDHRDQLAARNLEIVLSNLKLADSFFERHGGLFQWKRPHAGPIAFPRFLPGGATAFCRSAAEDAGVMLLPSTVYDVGDSHIRFGFGRRSFANSLQVLEDHLSRFVTKGSS